jgi:signal transduction histidine kinase
MQDIKIKILVVEDDFQNRQLIHIYLRQAEYDVTLSINGVDALEKLKSFTPDLIVSDISMPYMDGFQLYDRVKQIPHFRSIPFIFLTAHSDAEKRRHGKEIGSDDFLTKPIEQEDLIASIRGKLKRVDEIRSSAESQLFSQIDVLKREILSTITHEVNTPLFIIKLTANLLLDETMEFKPNELQELLQRIKRSGERLDSLLKDFLITVRIAAGEAKRENTEAKQDVDINYVIQHLIPMLKKLALTKNLSVETELDPNTPMIKIHVDQVADILERIFSNAVKFNKDNGKIFLKTKLESNKINVTIEDTGIGIPADKLPNVFNKFFQVNRPEMEQQGAGLGLAIAKDLAKINNADIVVESTEGMGSKFSIIFSI